MAIPELKNILEKNGVSKGDIICIFSDIASFGVPASLKKKVAARGLDFLLDAYLDTFKNLVGRRGLVVMPAFTYSATKGEIFDVKKSQSTVGALTEHFRKQPGVYRSAHPIFSFCAWGEKAKDFVKLKDFDSLGEKSILGKLYDLKAKYLLLGASLPDSATFVLYSEQKNKVYYRYFKFFQGIIRDGKKKFVTPVRYFVRDYNYNYSWGKLEKEGVRRGIIKKFSFGSGQIRLMASRAIDGLIKEKLKADKNYLVRKESII